MFAKETKPFALLESATMRASGEGEPTPPSAKEIFLQTSWKNKTLFNISQAGLINNMNDGLRWGLLPVVFTSAGLSMHQIALLAMIFPAFWGVGQLFTGYLSDLWGRKPLIVWGMLLQGVALCSMVFFPIYEWWMISGALTGVGTAMIYPTLIAAIGDVTGPSWRASAVGVYRLLRDGGYVVGALISGIIADTLGYNWAIGVIGLMSVLSGVLVAVQMKETLIRYKSVPLSLQSLDSRILSWILEKLVIQFSENFFCTWLEIAGKRSKEISVPSWKEIENMRDQSFPSVAFKYNFDESSSSSSIEYYHLSKNESILNKFKCLYQHESAKGDIQSIISYTPQKVAMLIMNNPSDENKMLQKTVETYVKKLNF
ncbi:MFS transporter [Paenibacillus xylanivorans]|uniref:MFS transporter n=1 Tax=Paenibacillus xylanivorans TaxID=1705561 RepID=UPI001F02D82C|nr:MFS transporter [Paenibacillus xylanivorans]